MWFSSSVDIAGYAEAAIYGKNFLFSHSVVSQWSLANNTGSGTVKLTKCDKVECDEKCH